MSDSDTNNHSIQIDILDILRLLYAAASEETKPILKAAGSEIKQLREQIGILREATKAMTLEIRRLHGETEKPDDD